MASFVYTKFKEMAGQGLIDLSSDTLKIILVGSTTTADTEEDTQYIGDFSTLGELANSGNYSRKTLGSVTFAADNSNNRAELHCSNVAWTALTGTPAQPVGAILCKHVTNDADSVAIAWIDGSAWPITNGGDYTIVIDAEGLLQLT